MVTIRDIGQAFRWEARALLGLAALPVMGGGVTTIIAGPDSPDFIVASAAAFGVLALAAAGRGLAAAAREARNERVSWERWDREKSYWDRRDAFARFEYNPHDAIGMIEYVKRQYPPLPKPSALSNLRRRAARALVH